MMFCRHCGHEINDKAVICLNCGCTVGAIEPMPEATAKAVVRPDEWLTAVLLCIFLGTFGIHRFYTKNTEIGAAQLVLGLLSCGVVSWIWSFIDMILLLAGSYTTGDGRLLTKN